MTASSSVAIVDLGMGNLFSVEQAVRAAGLMPVRATAPEGVVEADAIVLPGVGAFGEAMARLRRAGLDAELIRAADAGKPLLGICLGMQLMMSRSSELGDHAGLDLIPGDVRSLADVTNSGAKVPNFGWARLNLTEEANRHAGMNGLRDGMYMYFAHSFYCEPRDQADLLATSVYCGHAFASAVSRGNLMGCQFHPEKSGYDGLLIYRNFAAVLADRVTAGSSA